jgi:hypothetical protein
MVTAAVFDPANSLVIEGLGDLAPAMVDVEFRRVLAFWAGVLIHPREY